MYTIKKIADFIVASAPISSNDGRNGTLNVTYSGFGIFDAEGNLTFDIHPTKGSKVYNVFATKKVAKMQCDFMNG